MDSALGHEVVAEADVAGSLPGSPPEALHETWRKQVLGLCPLVRHRRRVRGMSALVSPSRGGRDTDVTIQ